MRSVRSSRPTSRRPDQKSRLGVEKLEDRSLMAGNVTAAVSNGTLVITGDTAGNGITVDYIQATDSYQVIGTTQGGSNTTVNGLDTSVAGNAQVFTNVTGLRIVMNSGDDNLIFGAATSTTFVVDKSAEIDMGAGTDTVAIGRNTGAATTENEVNIGKNLSVKLGNGGDTVDITNTTVGRDLIVHGDVNNPRVPANDGADTVRFITTFTPAAGAEQVFPVTVGRNATVLLGGGNDTFNADNFFADKLFIQDLGGTLTFDLTDSNIGGELKIQQTGGLATNIEVDNVNAGTLRMTTGNGVDTIAIRDSLFSRMYIDTGAAVDRLTIGATRVKKAGIINGGRDKTRLTQEAGNNLRGVVKIKTFTP